MSDADARAPGVALGGRPSPAEFARQLGDGWEAAGPAAAVRAEPLTEAAVWSALDGVPDPEVPAISVVELGIVRGVDVAGRRAVVTITPTYSGCPAMREIERDVRAACAARGWEAEVRTAFAPAWTTDWMTDAAREKLRAYGIAPPGRRDAGPVLVPLLRRRGDAPAPSAVPCPWCGALDTVLRSAFGSTACKAMHSCRACGEPFEEFKAV